MNWIVLCIVVIYMLILLGIGIYSSGKIKSTSDYLIAGRQLPFLLLAGTLAATALDGGSTLGIVGNSFGRWGISAGWYVIAMGMAFLMISFIAPRLRATEAKTVPEFLRIRYHSMAGMLHGILTIISMIGLTAAQLKASATVVEVMTGLDYITSLLIVSVIISFYSMIGGFWGVALTDAIQLVLIFLGMSAALPFALRMSGGWRVVLQSVDELTMNPVKGIGGGTEILAYIILFFTAFLVGEEVISSYYAAESSRAAQKGSWIAGIIVIVFAGIPSTLGLIIRSMYNNNLLNYGVVLALDQDAKYALPALAVKSMPPVVAGILFAGIISATMSSADSSLLGAGSVFVNDIYHVYVNPEASTKKMLGIAKVAMVFVMTASFFAAIYGGNILTILAFSFGIRAAGSFVPYIMGHLWKRGNSVAAVMSILVGTMVFLWATVAGHGYSHAWPIFPGLLSSAVTYMILSLLPGR